MADRPCFDFHRQDRYRGGGHAYYDRHCGLWCNA